MDYWKYELVTQTGEADILMAYLSDTAFDTFEDTANGLVAYLPASADQQATEDQLRALQLEFEFSWEKTFIPGQNWNEIWETNFHPVVVGDFCAVRADFHAPIPGVQYELVVNPKMAFGTGHHETTYMCLAAQETLPLSGQHLLDYGCGTGILAILAAKLGAAHIEAVDIEEESYLNTLENSQINGVAAQITSRCGTLDAITGTAFDGIFANINRNVILDSLPRLFHLLRPNGWLLVSGILIQDEEIVTAAAMELGFRKGERRERGNWMCMLFYK
jgi:ribosomal protein L11 methyltransferase